MDTITPKIVRKTSPYLRRPKATVTRMMRDVTIALIPAILVAIYSFGWDAVIIIGLSIISMVLTEFLYYLIQDLVNKETVGTSFTLYNFSAVTSGLIYGLTLADKTPWYAVIIGGALGIFLSKLIFGGMGQNIFNPAAVARVLVVVIYGTSMSYSAHSLDGVAGATALKVVADAGVFDVSVLNDFSLLNLFTGMAIPGSIGEVSALALLLGGGYLAFRTSFEVRIPLTIIGTVFILGLAVGFAVPGLNAFEFAMFHVLSGGLLFGAIYMATDPITSPITKPGRIAAGFMIGFVTFIIRLFGAYPEGVVFSILLMNMFVSTFDYYKWSKSTFSVKRALWFALVVSISIIVVLVGVYYAR